MLWLTSQLQKTLRVSTAFLMGISLGLAVAACSSSGKRYTNCMMNPKDRTNPAYPEGYGVCSTDGNPEHNFKKSWIEMENYGAFAPSDLEALLQELVICRQGKRPGH